MPSLYRDALDPARREAAVRGFARQRLVILAITIALAANLALPMDLPYIEPLIKEALVVGILFASVQVLSLSLTVRTLRRFGRSQDAAPHADRQ